MARINAAMDRIETARLAIEAAPPAKDPAKDNAATEDPAGSARVMALVNAHEKLREEVADTIGQIDTLIEGLEA